MDLQAISDLQALIDSLDAQISGLQNQKQELEQKIQSLRLISDSVDYLDYSATKVKQAVANIYDVKADKWAESVKDVLDEKQMVMIKAYATDALVVKPTAAAVEDIKG